MPPVKPKVIGVKCEAANAGEYIIVRNLTNGQIKTQAIGGSDKSTVVDAAPDFEWSEGDLIQAEIQGRVKGSKQGRIQAGGVQIILNNATADTATPGLTL